MKEKAGKDKEKMKEKAESSKKSKEDMETKFQEKNGEAKSSLYGKS